MQTCSRLYCRCVGKFNDYINFQPVDIPVDFEKTWLGLRLKMKRNYISFQQIDDRHGKEFLINYNPIKNTKLNLRILRIFIH